MILGCDTYTHNIWLGLSPLPVTVATRIITFFVGDPYKPSFATVTGRGDNPTYDHIIHHSVYPSISVTKDISLTVHFLQAILEDSPMKPCFEWCQMRDSWKKSSLQSKIIPRRKGKPQLFRDLSTKHFWPHVARELTSVLGMCLRWKRQAKGWHPKEKL